MIICGVSGLEPERTLRSSCNYLLVDIDIPVMQKQKEMQIGQHGCELMIEGKGADYGQ